MLLNDLKVGKHADGCHRPMGAIKAQQIHAMFRRWIEHLQVLHRGSLQQPGLGRAGPTKAGSSGNEA